MPLHERLSAWGLQEPLVQSIPCCSSLPTSLGQCPASFDLSQATCIPAPGLPGAADVGGQWACEGQSWGLWLCEGPLSLSALWFDHPVGPELASDTHQTKASLNCQEVRIWGLHTRSWDSPRPGSELGFSGTVPWRHQLQCADRGEDFPPCLWPC